ncbi:MAG TPA: response regulator, partial [Anaerolineae bacterium]|nr:response regulator [Anaerolineae bacterium]
MEPPSIPLILVVDDNAVIRTLVKTILASQGMDIDSASDGDEALAYLHRRRPDVVLLDLGMPRVDGLEVLRHVRGDPALH